MKRLPAVAFGALVAMTVAAFFITQHLKTSDPLIAGFRPVPGWINPVSGKICPFKGEPTSFRRMTISFFLPDHSDTVGVLIVDPEGDTIRTIGYKYMPRGQTTSFIWNGREDDGRVAPDGTYYVRVVLKSEGRSFTLPNQVHIETNAPITRVLHVTPSTLGNSGATVKVHFKPQSYRSADLVVYRSALSGHLSPVATVPVTGHRGVATWNGEIDGRPASAGTYLIGLRLDDLACNAGTFPETNPPAGDTAGAGLTVRPLSVTPQLYPVAAGTQATAYVDSGGVAYTWALRRPGAKHSLRSGAVAAKASSSAGSSTASTDEPLSVRLPAGQPGLYVLTVKSGSDAVSVPVVASTPRGARVLVIVPALTWEGVNPVDDDGNGIPDTLIAGDRINLNRPLVTGLPTGFADTAALLTYLRQMDMHYQLTTDVDLAEGSGPQLAGHSGVVLAGSFRWLPTHLAAQLRAYVQGGGQLLALGTNSLTALAAVNAAAAGSSTGPTAGPPVKLSVDPFGVRHGAVAAVGDALITTLSDPLRIFGAADAFTGFSHYQPLAPPAGVQASLAGVGEPAPTIAGFDDGHGSVIEVALPGFGANLPRDDASRQLLGRVWQRFLRR